MEVNVDRLLETVLHLDSDKVGESLTANVDMREKLEALKAIAFIRKPNESWFATVEEFVNYVDGVLRPARNRFVHDLWVQNEAGVAKRTRKPLIRKPQSFQPRELVMFTEAPVAAAEIWLLADSIQVAGRTAMLLKHDYQTLEARRRASLPIPP